MPWHERIHIKPLDRLNEKNFSTRTKLKDIQNNGSDGERRKGVK